MENNDEEPTYEKFKKNVYVWRGQVSQDLKYIHRDIQDIKINYDAFQKRMWACRKEVNNELDCLKKKVYYLLGAFAIIIILIECLFR